MMEDLSIDEQEDLINIIRHRQIDRRRDEIAANIIQAHQEYQEDKVFRGSTDEIIAELNK
jgi:hypothetical protein